MCNDKYMQNAPVKRLRHPLEDSALWSMMTNLLTSALAIVIGLPVLIVIAVMVPSCLILKWFLLLIFWNRQSSILRSGGGPESLRGNDGRWLGSAWRCSVIHAVLVFEAGSGLDVTRLRHLLLTRVVPLYPRLTRRPVPLPLSAGAGYCWLPDSQFNIERHVFAGPSHLNTEQQLQSYVGKLLEEGLPSDKPPWELHVVQSYGRHADTVAVLRVHQSVADGMALVRVLCHSLTDCKVLHVPQRPHFGALTFTVNLVRACLVGPLTLLFWLLLTNKDCNIFTKRNSWTGKVTVTWSAAITLPKVTRIKQVTRSSVNCVLISALAGAVRRLMQGCGVMQPPDIKVVLPVDLRSDVTSTMPNSRLGSKVAPVVMGLPVSIEGAVPRLWATRSCLESLRTSADPVVVYIATAALMTAIPGCLARKILSALTSKASLQFSSLQGPPSTLLVGGHPLKGVYPLLPAQNSLGLAISVFTYADQVYVAAISDSTLKPAASILLQQLHAQVEILWKLLLNRRVPGEARPHLSICRPDVTGSPVRELRLRLCNVQKEVQKLSQTSENDTETIRLQHLKTEFSQLLSELQRRHSSVSNSSPYFEDEEVNGELWRPRRRAMSCTSSRRSSRILTGGSRPPSFAESSPSASQSDVRLCNNCSDGNSSFSCCQGLCTMTTHHKAIKGGATKNYQGNINEDFIEEYCDASCSECLKENVKINIINEQNDCARAYNVQGNRRKVESLPNHLSGCEVNAGGAYSKNVSDNRNNEAHDMYKNYLLLEKEENTSESEYESVPELDTPDDDGSLGIVKTMSSQARGEDRSSFNSDNTMTNRVDSNPQDDYTAISIDINNCSSSTKSSPKHQYCTSFLHVGKEDSDNENEQVCNERIKEAVMSEKNTKVQGSNHESQNQTCETTQNMDKRQLNSIEREHDSALSVSIHKQDHNNLNKADVELSKQICDYNSQKRIIDTSSDTNEEDLLLKNKAVRNKS